MSKPVKVILGIATLWPFVYLLVFMGFWLYMVLWGVSHQESTKEIPVVFIGVFILHFITMIWTWGLLAIYICNVFKNDRVATDKKALWAVVLFFGNMIAMPIYWYLYIWREDEPLPKIEGPSPGLQPSKPLPVI